jgi:hypothetical protein
MTGNMFYLLKKEKYVLDIRINKNYLLMYFIEKFIALLRGIFLWGGGGGGKFFGKNKRKKKKKNLKY